MILQDQYLPVGAGRIGDTLNLVEIGMQRVDFKRRGKNREQGSPVDSQGNSGLDYADALTKPDRVQVVSPPCILPQRNGGLNRVGEEGIKD